MPKLDQKTIDGAELMDKTIAFYKKYGEQEYMRHIISDYAQIRGGISFNNAKAGLEYILKRYKV